MASCYVTSKSSQYLKPSFSIYCNHPLAYIYLHEPISNCVSSAAHVTRNCTIRSSVFLNSMIMTTFHQHLPLLATFHLFLITHTWVHYIHCPFQRNHCYSFGVPIFKEGEVQQVLGDSSCTIRCMLFKAGICCSPKWCFVPCVFDSVVKIDHNISLKEDVVVSNSQSMLSRQVRTMSYSRSFWWVSRGWPGSDCLCK